MWTLALLVLPCAAAVNLDPRDWGCAVVAADSTLTPLITAGPDAITLITSAQVEAVCSAALFIAPGVAQPPGALPVAGDVPEAWSEWTVAAISAGERLVAARAAGTGGIEVGTALQEEAWAAVQRIPELAEEFVVVVGAMLHRVFVSATGTWGWLHRHLKAAHRCAARALARRTDRDRSAAAMQDARPAPHPGS